MSNIDHIMNTRGQDIEQFYTLTSLVAMGLDKRSIACILELIECGIDPDSITDCKCISVHV